MSTLDWSEGELALGLRCYRRAEFFAAHEHWESVWLTLREPEKTFLQAVIQVAAAFHHFQRKNLLGMSFLLGRAQVRLERYPDEFGGVAVAQLRSGIANWLVAAEEGSDAVDLEFPPIGVCKESGSGRTESR